MLVIRSIAGISGLHKKGGDNTRTRIISEDQRLANELRLPRNRKFQRRKMYSYYRDNIWGADLENMKLISK